MRPRYLFELPSIFIKSLANDSTSTINKYGINGYVTKSKLSCLPFNIAYIDDFQFTTSLFGIPSSTCSPITSNFSLVDLTYH